MFKGMARFIGLIILAAVVVLLGHPAFTMPPLAIAPLLLVALPLLSFYVTNPEPEPQLCHARSSQQPCDESQKRRRYPMQL